MLIALFALLGVGVMVGVTGFFVGVGDNVMVGVAIVVMVGGTVGDCVSVGDVSVEGLVVTEGVEFDPFELLQPFINSKISIKNMILNAFIIRITSV